MIDPRDKPPAHISDVLAHVLERAGIAERVEQASIVPDWPALVGPQIAAVTHPLSITREGTLFVAVTTNAWMNELSLLEPELLRSMNARPGASPVRRIHWLLRR